MTMTAWHNPGNGHWIADGKECGYVDIITPSGETEEWRITHWRNDPSVAVGRERQSAEVKNSTPT